VLKSSDPEGDPPDSSFNYLSVIGMMGYLQANSRLDITFAVSQCAVLPVPLAEVTKWHSRGSDKILKGHWIKGFFYSQRLSDLPFQLMSMSMQILLEAGAMKTPTIPYQSNDFLE
jgi:hypothetical protein